ncbi:MAG: hypothetical protein AVDCRST_MAG56-6157 [uncultured Cytophagales bacterium]|uniref:Uncharacterized protein n=1 Tax=uncultured Cytophagales bacterium TaxID=158755 RepID=A0A6J4KMH1_9SPHI|nr:MAG: hypothetical protein AVDCRST_MAG56-6157 [uncultured Cytophagales bacterium]
MDCDEKGRFWIKSYIIRWHVYPFYLTGNRLIFTTFPACRASLRCPQSPFSGKLSRHPPSLPLFIPNSPHEKSRKMPTSRGHFPAKNRFILHSISRSLRRLVSGKGGFLFLSRSSFHQVHQGSDPYVFQGSDP